MPPNTVNENNSSDNVSIRKKGHQNESIKNKPANKGTAQLIKSKGLNSDFKVPISIAIIACLIVILSPTILKQLAQLKRALTKVPVDSRPVASEKLTTAGLIVDPDTGVEYEYHQFMATTEQHFSNIR